MSHHFKRLAEIQGTLSRIEKDNKKSETDKHIERLVKSVDNNQQPAKLGSSGALGYIGPAGISLAKSLIQKFKGSFRTGAKEIAKDQTIGAVVDSFNK